MDRSVGLFDSGVGGLAVLAHLHRLAPALPTTYVADRRHLPYGEKSEAFVANRAHALTKQLVDQGAAVVTMACNTASAAALEDLRRAFPGIRFVGMEPAIKPAAQATSTGVIGVLATRGTLDGQLMSRVATAFGGDVRIERQVGNGLASAVEFGAENESRTIAELRRNLESIRLAGADTLVLGCTHYSFLREMIDEIAEGSLQIIDPSEAVARQIVRMASAAGVRPEMGVEGARRYVTTADPDAVAARIEALTGIRTSVELVSW